VQNIMKHICEIAGATYKQNAKADISLRVITDHIRSTTFMVGDGVMPSNEGRGYVLRRLLRRAARHGRLLGVTEPFIYKVCDTVINENASAYPELAEKREYIKKVIRIEEENFAKTIDKGMELLNQVIDDVIAKNGKTISGDDTFKLSDTFGFPIDLTIEIAEEKGLTVDEKRYQELVQEQRAKARADRAAKAGSSWSESTMGAIAAPKTEFIGYKAFEGGAKVAAIIKDGAFVTRISEGDDASIILDKTPFYAESGGQVGDTGLISAGANRFEVFDCKKTATGHFIHIGTLTVGEISVGDSVNAAIDADRRKAIMRNHTSAHLLQQALRMVLGSHVHQAGSLVDAEKCRFDFSHFSAVAPKELAEVESIVNGFIMSALDVNVSEMPIKEAKELGATALFGEKYGDIVRVCNISGKSIELCGGTHIDNTAKIGLFKIISESSVAAGVRRIEAATGLNVIKLIDEANEKLYKACENLKISNANELAEKTAALSAELKVKDKQIEELNAKIAEQQTGSLFENAVEIGGVTLITAALNGTKPEVLRTIGDKIRDKSPKTVAVLSSVNDGKATLLAVCGPEAVKLGVNAGKLIKDIAAKVGGSGGGRPDSAMGGIADINNVDAALNSAAEIIKAMQK
ncbi:MAG TPA: alanine--tRNA ligase, partial [Ruminococcaceae bacterium]|nr:alanine--tRNA ligase [Oscillospiraceae bacterium]